MIVIQTKLTSALSIALIALFILPAATGVSKSTTSVHGIVSPLVGGSPMTFNVTIHGRGASFPAPMITTWATNYHAVNPAITINYRSVGSGAGQRAFMNKTDDFDATDAPLQQIQRPLTPNVLHIPETIGSVVLAYNLPSVPTSVSLNLTGSVIAQIYQGTILNWNDAAIQSLNPHITLPSTPITTVHRSDSSGTTFVFTSFLSQDSASWAAAIGFGTTVNWPGSPTGSPPPIALTGNGNGGVAAVIASTQNSFGYVELNYALQNGFTSASIQNPAGNYISASLATTSFAVENSTTILPTGNADWSGVSMLNRPGSQTYPIASFTYLIVYKELNVLPSMNVNETFQANALINFLYWVVNAGQQYTSALSYVPLPTFVRQIDNATISSITYSTPAKNTESIHLFESSAGGWNTTTPGLGPTITIYSGDTLNLFLSSTDSANHQWYIDFNHDGILNANEVATESAVFNTVAYAASPSIVPAIGVNVPAAGNYTYRDNNNPANSGIIQIIQQQVAAVFLVPAALSSGFAQKIDGSKATAIGTLVINMRTLTFSGNITEAAVDATSGSITFIKAFLLPNLQLHTVPTAPGTQFRFLLNAAVLPYPVSTIVFLQLNGVTPTLTTQLTREVDMAANGFVSIVDVGVVFANYGFSVGNPNYNPQADLSAAGTVNILSVGIVALHYGSPVFR